MIAAVRAFEALLFTIVTLRRSAPLHKSMLTPYAACSALGNAELHPAVLFSPRVLINLRHTEPTHCVPNTETIRRQNVYIAQLRYKFLWLISFSRYPCSPLNMPFYHF